MRESMLVVVFIGAAAACNEGGPRRCAPDFSLVEATEPRAEWDTLADARGSCSFGADSPTSESLGTAAPAIPDRLKHVVILMRENRSFDHFLSEYVPPDGQTVDVGTDETNPDPTPPRVDVPRYRELRYCVESSNHEWGGSHLQYNNGRMNGFIAADHSNTMLDGRRSMGYYGRSDVPFYYWLAENFTISDRYFSSMLGPTMPNLYFYFRATSCGFVENADTNPEIITNCGIERPTIFSRLADAGVSYRVYSDASGGVSGASMMGVLPATHVPGTINDFLADIAADRLPTVVFVEPNYKHSGLGTRNDDHAPVNIQVSQRFVYRVVSGLMSNATVWDSSILFITWDEHGGLYDHVPPPKACPPDASTTYDFDFDRYGIRVPFFAISPFARKGYVSHHTVDHTSILRFIEHWKGLPALTARDANAWPLLDMFDFAAPRTDITPPDASLALESTNLIHVGSCSTAAAVGK